MACTGAGGHFTMLRKNDLIKTKIKVKRIKAKRIGRNKAFVIH